MVSYLTASVTEGRADWGSAVKLPETAELWRRRAALWRAQRDRQTGGARPSRRSPAAEAEAERLRETVRELRTEHRIIRQVAARALERLLRNPPVSHQGVDRVRGYLAGERRLP